MLNSISKKLPFIFIICLAIFLLFFRLDRADMLTDDAPNSFQSIGYFDFLDSQLQTTPIIWFGEIPWWGTLSFHDHPPLVIAIQHLFFKIFGVSVFVARLPFALAGLGSIIILYFIVKRIYNKNLALLASFLLTIFNFHSWISRVGYLESIMIFFVLVTILFFFKALENSKHWILFGVFLGLTFLTKYTSGFLVPIFLFYILFTDKKILVNKKFILGLLVALLIFSPVILYNVMMFQTRGHFDLSFSAIFGQNQKDWPLFNRGGAASNYLDNIISGWLNLGNAFSIFICFLISLSGIYLLVNFCRNRKNNKNLFLILSLFFLLLLFAFVGNGPRFLPLYNPFFAILLAVFIFNLGHFIRTNKFFSKLTYYFYLAFLVLLFAFEIFYNINSNLALVPRGLAGLTYSSYRFDNLGYNQLEKYLVSEFKDKSYYLRQPQSINTISNLKLSLTDVKNQDIFVYDSNLNWFASLWYFRKWAVYHRVPFISDADLVKLLPPQEVNWFNHFAQNGAKNFYYIKGASNKLLNDNLIFNGRHEISTAMEKGLIANQKMGALEEKLINDPNGEAAFKVYKLKLN